MNYKPLSQEDEKVLDELNQKVTLAIKAKRRFLDDMMEKYTNIKVGQDIYDTNTCRKLGKVTKLYRYWADRDEGVRDEYFSVSYEFLTPSGSYDNTSRNGDVGYGSLGDATLIQQYRLDRLTRKQEKE